jgi:hypothetical protein
VATVTDGQQSKLGTSARLKKFKPLLQIMRATRPMVICLAALLAVGYTIHKIRDSKLRHKLNIPANAAIWDFGAVGFSSGVARSFPLGSGKDLTVTATTITNETLLATVPATFTNGVLQISLSYTSKTEMVFGTTHELYTEQQTFMYPQSGLLAITLADDSRNPVAVVMRPNLTPK